VNRSRHRSTILIDIFGASLSGNLAQQNISVHQNSIKRVEFTQLQTDPPIVRMTMFVDKNSPDWEVSTSSLGGLVILPYRFGGIAVGHSSGNSDENQQRYIANFSTSNLLSTITSVEISDGGTQLVIRGNRHDLFATGGWDKSTNSFRITIPNAKLGEAFKGPDLNSSTSIFRVRLQQQDPHTVVIFIQPAPGVQIRLKNQVGDSSVVLELKRTRLFALPLTLPPIPRLNPKSSSDMLTNPPLSQAGNTIHGRVVVIVDPGHGGKDSGALGIGGAQEKDIVLPIGRKVAEMLRRHRIQVLLTRNSDYFVSLPGRVDMARQDNAGVFVSIHANSAGEDRPDVNGLEVYYYDSGLDLARVVRNRILQSVNVRDRGIRRARFYVLRKTSMPSILVETGYMTGREDMAKLKTSQYQNQMAEAIADGILQYLKRK
jgi:N-acetylmuramoyl-L-alanine amidase